MFWIVDIVSLLSGLYAVRNVKIELFGSSFIPAVVIATLIVLVLQQVKRPILRYGKWIKVD